MKRRLTKLFAIIISCMLLALTLAGTVQADPQNSAPGFSVQINSHAGGLNFRSGAGTGYASYCNIPDGTVVYISDMTYNTTEGLFWGLTSYGGYSSGWVCLTMTNILKGNGYHNPDFYVTVKTMYDSGVVNLRYGAGLGYAWYLQIPNGTQLHITDMVFVPSEGLFWGLTSYGGYTGYVSLRQASFIKGSYPVPVPPQPAPVPVSSYQVNVYDTGTEGLALKSAPNVNAGRYCFIPDKTALTITQVTSDGWGYTSYNGNSGWVFLQYTKINGDYASEKPSYGFITPANYVVYNTWSEGLEFRTAPTTKCSTFGPLYDGSVIQVQAIQGSWAYGICNGHYGWANLTYLYRK